MVRYAKGERPVPRELFELLGQLIDERLEVLERLKPGVARAGEASEMRTIAVDINGTDYRARILNHEDNWEPAALRAVQKRFGKAAAVWRWTLDSREVDQQGHGAGWL